MAAAGDKSRPLRIVLTCWGSYGDLFPYLAIAIRLKAMGHVPVLAASRYYRELVEQEGVEFAAVRPDIDPDDGETIRRVMDPVHGTEVIVRELLAPAVRGAFDDLSPIVEGADLIVTHPVTFAAPLVAESLGVTWLSAVLAPTSMFSVYDFPLLPPYPAILRFVRAHPGLARGFMRLARRITRSWTSPVRQLRDELGLPLRGEPLYEGQFSPHGTLALFSPIFGAPQRDWPPGTTATGFVFYRTATRLAPEVDAFLAAGPPPVVFTLGSSAVGAAGRFYEESVAAAEVLGSRALLLVGLDPRNRAGRVLPPTVLAASYVPHALIFPRASAVVHHGGIGTTAQALAAGRPMLVVPHAHDQPDNAFRCERLGVARALDAGAYTARRVVPHLAALLSDARYAERAATIAARLSGEDGLGVACREIVAAAQRRPVGRPAA